MQPKPICCLSHFTKFVRGFFVSIGENIMTSSNGKAKVQVEDIQRMSMVIGKRQILTWDDMMREPEKPEWIIKNLVMAGSVITVYGSGGSKKTYSMIDMIFSIQMRSDWLGFEIPKPVNILMIDEESGRNRLSLRYREARNGYNTRVALPIYTICMTRFSLRDRDDVRELEKAIQATNARVVVIDSLVTVLQGDENSSKEITQLYNNLSEIAKKMKIAIFVIHHSNKLEGYRGSSAIRDQSDLLIKISSKSGSPNIDFETEKERDVDHQKWAAISCLDKNKKFYLISSKSSRLSKLGKAQEHIINYLLEYQQATMEDLKTNH